MKIKNRVFILFHFIIISILIVFLTGIVYALFINLIPLVYIIIGLFNKNKETI